MAFLAAMSLSFQLMPFQAAAADGAAIAHDGNGHGASGCRTCHGERGEGNAEAGFPRLSGLSADYLVHQLDSFRDGRRASDTMAPVAKALAADELKAVADYYAGLPASQPPPADKADPALLARGEELAQRGEWQHGLPGCGQCHGAAGLGAGTAFPALAGQPEAYIAAQLTAWQDGTRKNDPLGLMAGIVRKLDKDRIAAVSAYYASLPAGRISEGGSR